MWPPCLKQRSTWWATSLSENKDKEQQHVPSEQEVRDSFHPHHPSHGEDPGVRKRGSVVVRILDQNDEAPLSSPPSYRVTISEDMPLKSPICKVSATDADLGQNAEFYYAFNTRSEMFAIHPASGGGHLGWEAQRHLAQGSTSSRYWLWTA